MAVYAWAPPGFYDPEHPWPGSMIAVHNPAGKTGGWSRKAILAFYPLWVLDTRYVHKNKTMQAS